MLKPARQVWHPGLVHPSWLWALKGLRSAWLFSEKSGRHVHAVGRDRRHGRSQSPVWDQTDRGSGLDIGGLRARRIEVTNFSPVITGEITALAVSGRSGAEDFSHMVSRHPGWFLTLTGDGASPRFAVTAGGTVYTAFASSTVPLLPDTSVVVGRYDGSAVSIWRDGVNEAQVAASGALDATGQMRIGDYGASADNQYAFSGTIVMVAVWDRALTDAEIRRLSLDPFGFFRPFDGPEVFVSGGISLAINSVTETDTAVALTKSKIKQINSVLETDTAVALLATIALAINTVIETDEAQVLGATLSSISQAINAVIETDSAIALSTTADKAILPVEEVDSAIALGTTSKSKAILLVEETDLVIVLTADKNKTIQFVTETDSAIAVTGGTAGGIQLAINPVIETDSAIALLVSSKHKAINALIETDTAVGLAASKNKLIAFVTETDLIIPLGATISSIAQAINTVIENDSAIVLGKSSNKAINTVQETDLANILVALKSLAITPVTEVDSALEVSSTKSKAIATVFEGDSAVPILIDGEESGLFKLFEYLWRGSREYKD